MKASKWSPSPKARLIATTAGIIGALLANQSTLALCLAVWCLILIPLLYCGGVLRGHLYTVATILLPMLIMLLIVWGYLVGAAPGGQLHSAPLEGVSFALTTFARLALLTALTQLCFGTIPNGDLKATLFSWGLRGDALVLVITTISLVPEARLRASQVIAARYARGLMKNRSALTRLLNLPAIIPPLLACLLRSGLQRAEQWNQKHLLANLRTSRKTSTKAVLFTDIPFLLIAGCWLATQVYFSLQRTGS